MYLFKLDPTGKLWTLNYQAWEPCGLAAPVSVPHLEKCAQRVGFLHEDSKGEDRGCSYHVSSIDLDSPDGMMLLEPNN